MARSTLGLLVLGFWAALPLACTRGHERAARELRPTQPLVVDPSSIGLLLAGDVMTGRGIDQLLPHSSPRQLYERSTRDAQHYVALAERANGPLPGLVPFAYPWGAALDELERLSPDLRIVNLETSVTRSDRYWKGKPVHYRMHPDNLPVLQAARIDYCALANNHTLDWGRSGLLETIQSLGEAGIRYSGAGRDAEEAARPAVLPVDTRGRVLVFSYGLPSSGIPAEWAASSDRAGVNLLSDPLQNAVDAVARSVRAIERRGDVVVVSVHWGDNWGYEIPTEQVGFAHALIESAGVDVVHGHSSHHAKGIEVYRGKLVLYGAGDLLNDYEGIAGHEAFRPDLGLLYTARLDPASGRLLDLRLTPLQRKRLSLHRASRADGAWLLEILNREGRPLGAWLERGPDGDLLLRWE